MTDALVASVDGRRSLAVDDQSLPPVPWRDPHTVSPADLAVYIRQLEQACLDNPQSADLRTCLGMAHAVNYDVYKSMAALEDAMSVEPLNFWAQFKYAELHYRLRALPKAERETLKAVDLARTPWQLSLARHQLRQVRKLLHEGTRTVEWTQPLWGPTLAVGAVMTAVILVGLLWR